MNRDEVKELLDGAVYDAVFTQEHESPGGFILKRLEASGLMVVPGWQDIADAPPVGTIAMLYTPPTEADEEFEGLDYRYELAMFRETELGRNWHEQGTNHLVSERKDMGWELPTHFMPLPASPLAGRDG